MRPVPAAILIATLWAEPAPGLDRFPPHPPARPAATDAARDERLNRAEKARQDAFDARLDHRNRRIAASLCRGCGRAGRRRPFDRGEGAGTGGESIYSPAKGFDPSRAPE